MITDLKKYKRIFAFGCSFTSYLYPTWADMVYKSMSPDVEFYNLGKSGGGNLFISHRIVEANKKHKFNENDLILVMWSTFARFDFYKTNYGWKTPGNIYTQDELSKSTVSELEDLNWFLMRDLSTIELTTHYLNNLPCGILKFMSVPLHYEYVGHSTPLDNVAQSMIELYSDLLLQYPKETLFEFMGNKWSGKIKYVGEKNMPVDYHPTPVDYVNYLIKCNVPVTQEAIDYARESLDKLLTPNMTKLNAINMFPDCDSRITNSFRVTW
jgi:hypothetical protein